MTDTDNAVATPNWEDILKTIPEASKDLLDRVAQTFDQKLPQALKNIQDQEQPTRIAAATAAFLAYARILNHEITTEADSRSENSLSSRYFTEIVSSALKDVGIGNGYREVLQSAVDQVIYEKNGISFDKIAR
jgi:hypothetical protein